jgi:hypothetical protein
MGYKFLDCYIQPVNPESPARDKSLRPNSGWTSEPFDPMVSQGRKSRPESPGHRGGVSALDIATDSFRGDPLHHYHLREAPH